MTTPLRLVRFPGGDAFCVSAMASRGRGAGLRLGKKVPGRHGDDVLVDGPLLVVGRLVAGRLLEAPAQGQRDPDRPRRADRRDPVGRQRRAVPGRLPAGPVAAVLEEDVLYLVGEDALVLVG